MLIAFSLNFRSQQLITARNARASFRTTELAVVVVARKLELYDEPTLTIDSGTEVPHFGDLKMRT